jgi:N-acyl-L-homoserine lactone synthetase
LLVKDDATPPRTASSFELSRYWLLLQERDDDATTQVVKTFYQLHPTALEPKI